MAHGTFRKSYFCNILLLIGCTVTLYLISNQYLYQTPEEHHLVIADGSHNYNNANKRERHLAEQLASFNNNVSDAKATTISSVNDVSHIQVEEKTEQEVAQDWYKLFTDTAQKVYEMFTPKNLNAFRRWAVDKEREALQREMRGYKFVEKNRKLDDLILDRGGQPIRNAIFTSWRSGSTFIGEVLDSHPATFYLYEPLLHFGILQVRNGNLAKEGVRVLNELLNCRYDNLTDYMKYGETHHWLFSHNTRVAQFCEKSREVCWDPKFLQEMCSMFPFQSLKTVRMRLHLAKQLLDDKKLNLQLLLLVRDPRGVIQSRNHRDWCPGNPDCENPSLLCSDMVLDYQTAVKFRKKYPNQFRAVRYEDISLNPYSAVKSLFSFFRLQYHPRVESFLDIHTVVDKGGVSSTFRDYKTAPFHWKKDYERNFTQIDYIQKRCAKAMKLWGYALATDENLATLNPVLDPPWPEMRFPHDDIHS